MSELLSLIKFFDVPEQDGSLLLDCLIQTGVYDSSLRTIIHYHHWLWSDVLEILGGKKTFDQMLCLGTEKGRPLIVSQYHYNNTGLQPHHYLLTFCPQKTERGVLFSSSYARVYSPLKDINEIV